MNFEEPLNIELNNEFIGIHQYSVIDKNGLEQQFDPEIFNWFTRDYNTCDEFIQDKLEKLDKKEQVPYIVKDLHLDQVVGTFSLGNIDLANKSIEIGSIWFGKSFIGSFYNAMTNLLILEYLFERLKFNRVQWKTDKLNLISQKAALSLGFTQEGILRKHIIKQSGVVRDTVMFSIIIDEWETGKIKIKDKIANKLAKISL